jgi:hypothetical protein
MNEDLLKFHPEKSCFVKGHVWCFNHLLLLYSLWFVLRRNSLHILQLASIDPVGSSGLIQGYRPPPLPDTVDLC